MPYPKDARFWAEGDYVKFSSRDAGNNFWYHLNVEIRAVGRGAGSLGWTKGEIAKNVAERLNLSEDNTLMRQVIEKLEEAGKDLPLVLLGKELLDTVKEAIERGGENRG